MTAGAVRGITDRRLVAWGLVASLLAAGFGLSIARHLAAVGLARPAFGNIFFLLFARHEPLFLALIALTSLISLAVVLRRRDANTASTLQGPQRLEALPLPGGRALMLLAVAIGLVSTGMWYLVHHELLFSMDEFMAEFQARIFAKGKLTGIVPPEWRPLSVAVVPLFTTYQDSGAWMSGYLPGYALLKTPFVLAGVGGLLNPLLTAGSVLALAAAARRIWPGEALRPWMAIAFFVTSSELLVTSGSGYSMPAHLFLNVLWLWLYLRDDARSWACALAVGVFALGLHSPFPHALFVAPFMLRLLRDRRWGRLGSAVAVYGVASVGLLSLMRLVQPLAGENGPGLLSVFAAPSVSTILLQTMNASLLFTWHAPLFGALVLVGIVCARRSSSVLVDLALGTGLTLAFFAFFPLTQGHGWGYRYAYQVLGSLALLAAAGVPSLVAATGARPAQWLLAGALAVAVVVQIPLRIWQTEHFVRPFAAGHRLVGSQQADVVLLHMDSVWYGRDLIRNDPFMQRPVVVNARRLTPQGRLTIERAHPGKVVDVTNDQLLRAGMFRSLRPQR